MAALSDSWGTCGTPDGKIIWFTRRVEATRKSPLTSRTPLRSVPDAKSQPHGASGRTGRAARRAPAGSHRDRCRGHPGGSVRGVAGLTRRQRRREALTPTPVTPRPPADICCPGRGETGNGKPPRLRSRYGNGQVGQQQHAEPRFSGSVSCAVAGRVADQRAGRPWGAGGERRRPSGERPAGCGLRRRGLRRLARPRTQRSLRGTGAPRAPLRRAVCRGPAPAGRRHDAALPHSRCGFLLASAGCRAGPGRPRAPVPPFHRCAAQRVPWCSRSRFRPIPDHPLPMPSARVHVRMRVLLRRGGSLTENLCRCAFRCAVRSVSSSLVAPAFVVAPDS